MTDSRHDHQFGQQRAKTGERRTILVVIITTLMMVIEIVAGIAYGSMALLADGLHMGSHSAALGLAVFAYIYARRHAGDRRFSFGTGKVNALAGFTGAVILVAFAAAMVIESVERFLNPVTIVFNHAIAVAVIGLVVNGASMFVLGGHGNAGNAEEHGHESTSLGRTHHDHNLRSAYLHVLADALTSLLAIFALLAGKYFGAEWLDPAMGIVGAALVIRWSWGLLRQCSSVLLDRQAPPHVLDAITRAIDEGSGDRIDDLHVWSIGPGYYAVEIAITSADPRNPDSYKKMLPHNLGLEHVTVEVSRNN